MSFPKFVKTVVVQEVSTRSYIRSHGALTAELAQNKTNAVQEVPIQVPGEGEILVRVRAVAINPTDWKRLPFSITTCGSSLNRYPLITQIRNG